MSQLNINTIKNKRGDYGPNLVGHSTVTGDLTVTGNITGDGSGLTGLGNTANIKSDTISNSGIITATGFVGPLTGDVTGNLTGGVTGNVIGNLTGDVTGGVTGNVTGDLTGNVTGNITGTTGTFSGNVSIGGTLTYEDVTNVDSVGMITARKGIQVLADGINAVGVVTATSFIGDGSNLSGVESGVANFVATGTISNGDTIVINTDGTVSAISGSGSPESIVGSTTTFETAQTTFTSVAYIPGGSKVVVAYCDNNNNAGKAVVGTVSGNSISFGTVTTFDSGSSISFVNCVYDTTNGKIVIVYNRNNVAVRSIVGTVSGTSISFGTFVEVYGGNGTSIRAIFAAGKIIVAFSASGGATAVGTVSGTSISWGNVVAFQSGTINDIALAYDSDEQKVVYMYGRSSNTGYGRVGTISGTTMTFGGTAIKLSGNLITDPSAVYEPIAKKIVLCFKTEGFGQTTDSVAMTVNVAGDVLTFGNEVFFDYGICGVYNAMYNANDNKIIICYNRDSGTGGGMIAVATVIGNEITFNSTVEFDTTSTAYQLGAAFDSTNNKVIVSYQQTSTNDGISRVIQPYGATTNLTSENYIGIAAEAISGGATGKINIAGGVNSGQSSLTVGKKYYVQIDGSLATTPTDPAVVAGTSVGATKIIVKG